ncbi:ATP-dependent helicase [Arcanobacterium phocisimile]|uniref:DNA 3'-5' helicase n=1 Tax=Arcanobacterium phocisimile TaxID=1302235 RepID=A0ABX7IFQ9_9ACTO|nr:ATP-dependent DNA helicase [Arcanobacterium phocisimile]QRV01690.1 ATP-dependent helicase [Arcanobacterium phocisimile]
MREKLVDASHEAVVSACEEIARARAVGKAISVVGASSTGKTTVLRQCLQTIIDLDQHARIAVLSPDRRAANEMRNEIVGELRVLSENVRVRSIAAFAFAIVSLYAQATGRKEPELLSGPDQDALLKELFDIATTFYPHANEIGSVDRDVAHMEAFRQEYRDLLTRAAELGITSDTLRNLGEKEGNPSWVIGADLLDEYEKALAVQAGTGYGQPDRTDHARIVNQAVAFLQQWNSPTTVEPRVACPQWDWILVDDISNCTLALRSLLKVLQDHGSNIVVFGDPDTGVQSFRGGIANLQSLLSRPLHDGGLAAHTYVLTHRYRGGGPAANIISTIESGIHVAGSAQGRKADYQYAKPLAISAHVLLSEHDETAYLASRIRRLHMEQKIGYEQIAVITRSRAGHQSLRQALLDRGVPVQPLAAVMPLRFQPAVANVLLTMRIAAGLIEPDELAENIRRLLTGPLFDMTSLDMASIIKRLHGWELLRGGKTVGEQLLLSVLDLDPQSPGAKIGELAKVRKVIAAVRDAIETNPLAEHVLWETWEKIGIAEQWQEKALEGGEEADQADRDLDAIIQLFRIAQRLSDRDPHSAHITDLLRVLEEQEVPEDSIARTSVNNTGIVLTSPAGALGQTWDRVFISSLNEGVWPNLQLRNPLTKVPELVSIVVGSELAGTDVPGEQRMSDVIDDELRMLLFSVLRAENGVEITCVNSEDTLPSRFMHWLFPEESQLLTEHHQESLTIDLPTFIGQLRRAQQGNNPELAELATSYLEQVSNANLAGMAEKMWADSIDYSDGDLPEGPVRVSPSVVEKMLTCPLRGVFDSVHGQALGDTALADLGTLIHQIAEETREPDMEQMNQRLDELWEASDFGSGIAAQQLYYRAKQMVEKLYRYLQDYPAEAEHELYARVERDNVIISGKIDRLEHVTMRPDEVRVVDFKTGKGSPAKSESETVPQLLIYQWLIEQGGLNNQSANEPMPTTSLGAQLVHIGTDSKKYSLTEQSPLDDKRRELAGNMIDTVAEIQRSASVPAIVNVGCRTCSYRSLCPAVEGKRIFS